MHFSDENYETRSSKLVNENAKYWVEFERRYSYLQLACSHLQQIARTSAKRGEYLEQALSRPLVGSLRGDDQRTSATTLHESVVLSNCEHFYKYKASLLIRIVVFYRCYTKYNFRLRNKKVIKYFSTHWLGWEFVYFSTCFVGVNPAKLILEQFSHYCVANNGLGEPDLL